MSYDPKNIIVAGSPGAFTNVINKRLVSKGWAVKWPNQDVDVAYGRSLLEHNAQNYEVQAINKAICDAAGVEVLSDKLPVYYDIPYPGPAELIRQFPCHAVISAPSLPPFLDIWRVTSDIVINIQTDETSDMTVLVKWSYGKIPENRLKVIRQVYVERYQRHLKLFPKVFTITNAEIFKKQFEELDCFLGSVLSG